MPTYKNNNNIDTTLNNKRIPPGGTLETIEFFVDLPAGITKISNDPTWNPVILVEKLSGVAAGSDIVVVPEKAIDQQGNNKTVDRYHVDIFCYAGEISVKFNTDSFDPPILLREGEGFRTEVLNRVIDNVRISYIEDSDIKVVIER